MPAWRPACADTIYGPFAVAEIFSAGGTYWSPVLEGDTAIVDVFVPDGDSLADVVMSICG